MEDNKLSIEVNSYRCSDCGALLGRIDDVEIKSCIYCNSPQIFYEGKKVMEYDEFALYDGGTQSTPALYKRRVKDNSFVPEEYLDYPEDIDLQTLYIPLWKATAYIKNDGMKMKCSHTNILTEYGRKNKEKKYIETKVYSVEAKVNGDIPCGYFNASESFRDDYFAGEVGDFHNVNIRNFEPGIVMKELKKCIIDLSERPADIYIHKAQKNYKRDLLDIIDRKITSRIGSHSRSMKKSAKDDVEYDFEKAYVPVKFFKDSNRELCIIKNSKSNRINVQTPIDFRKMFKPVFIIAAIVLILLTFLNSRVYVSPIGTSIVASYVLCCAIFLMSTESRLLATSNLYIRKGAGTVREHKEEIKWWNRLNKMNGWDMTAVGIFLIIYLFFLFGFCNSTYAATLKVHAGIMLVVECIAGLRTIFDSVKLGNYVFVILYVLGLIGQECTVRLAASGRPESVLYYISAVALYTLSTFMFGFSVIYSKKINNINNPVFSDRNEV